MTSQPAQRKAKLPIFNSLQAGRGIAALGVVFYHCEGVMSLSKYWGTRNHYFHFGASGVEFFFVLSGIVILHAHLSDLGKPARLGSYVQKRFRRIYPIYWVILLVLLSLLFVSPSLGKGFEREPKSIIDAIVLLPIFHIDTIIPVAWTLEHEVMFYIVFAMLILNKRWGQIVLVLWLLASVLVFGLPDGHHLLRAYMSPLHLLFGLGLLARALWPRIRSNGNFIVVVGFAGLIACAITDDILWTDSIALNLSYGVFAFLICLGCMLREKTQPMKFPKFLMILGNASYSLYLVHYAALSVVSKILFRVWQRYPTPLVIPFFFLVAFAVAIGLAVHFFVEIPLLRWTAPRTQRQPTPSSR